MIYTHVMNRPGLGGLRSPADRLEMVDYRPLPERDYGTEHKMPSGSCLPRRIESVCGKCSSTLLPTITGAVSIHWIWSAKFRKPRSRITSRST
jgi:hypothetical protein